MTDLDGAILASADLSTGPRTTPAGERDVARRRDARGGSSCASLTPAMIRLYVVDAGLTSAAAAEGAVIGTDIEATWPHLGGVADDGSILVFRGARGGTVADRLEAYDPATLAARPASDIVLAGLGRRRLVRTTAVSPGSASDDVLHLDGIEVPGEFAWARPVG